MQTYDCRACGMRNNYVGDPQAPPNCRRCGKHPRDVAADSPSSLQSIEAALDAERPTELDETRPDV